MSFSTADPFTGPVPPSVYLAASPLAGVLVQISFPEILSIADKFFVGRFQEQIRKDYPYSELEHNLSVSAPSDTLMMDKVPNWRFFDKNYFWRVSLTTKFVTIETRAYSGRTDLIERVIRIALALSDSVTPNIVTRIGVRYVDRIYGEPLSRITNLVRPEILGIYSPNSFKRIERTLNEVFAKTETASLVSRWGYMPSDQSHNIDLMPPINAPSWFLDTDVFNNYDTSVEFNSFDFKSTLTDFTSRAYSFFRWVVNDNFLRTYGGQV